MCVVKMASIADQLLTFFKSRAFFIFWIIFFIYMANQRIVTHTDPTPTRLLPISIIREGNFDLNEFNFLYNDTNHLPYYLKNIDGKIVSFYPVFTSLLAVPIYFIPVLTGIDPQSTTVLLLSKTTAALLIALSAAFLYLTLRHMANEKTSLVITAIYAFGTTNWPISSQDLWQHGAGELFICITLYALAQGGKKPHLIPYAGFALACAVAIRPSNLLTTLILTAYVFMKHRKQIRLYLLYATPPIIAILAYSQLYLGSVTLLGQMQSPTGGWNTPLFEGLSGLLASPSRGLFVYSPVLILSLAGIAQSWKKTETKYYAITIAANVLLWSKWIQWYGGNVYGPRLLIETLPFFCLLLAKPVETLYSRRTGILLLAVLIGLSVFINFLGAFEWDASWDSVHHVEESIRARDYEYLNRLWWSPDAQWAYYAKRFYGSITGISGTASPTQFS